MPARALEIPNNENGLWCSITGDPSVPTLDTVHFSPQSTFKSFSQSAKQKQSIVTIESGREIDSSDEQPAKADSPIVDT
jgi:hypothetical protein